MFVKCGLYFEVLFRFDLKLYMVWRWLVLLMLVSVKEQIVGCELFVVSLGVTSFVLWLSLFGNCEWALGFWVYGLGFRV